MLSPTLGTRLEDATLPLCGVEVAMLGRSTPLCPSPGCDKCLLP